MMAPRLTPAVRAILVGSVFLFLIQQVGDQFFHLGIAQHLGLVPHGFLKQLKLWQIVTYSLLHGDLFHILFNMLMLVFLGSELEGIWGTRRFLRYYLVSLVTGGLFYLFLSVLVWRGADTMQTPLVGASAGLYGLLGAYGILFSERSLLFMMLFPLRAKHFVILLGSIELFSTVFSPRGGLSGVAHLGGLVAGIAQLWLEARWRIIQRSDRGATGFGIGRFKTGNRRSKSQHLKLVVNRDPKKSTSEDDEDPSGRTGPRTWH